MHEAVAIEVRAEMTRQKVSQAALADRLGWPQQRVSRRITGAVPFDVTELAAVAAALGVPVARFIPSAGDRVIAVAPGGGVTR